MADSADNNNNNSPTKIPEHRSFQATKISSFTESRRQRFLSIRKQNREAYFEKARKLALRADTNSDHDSDEHDKNTSSFDFSWNHDSQHPANQATKSINKYSQYPPLVNMDATHDTESKQNNQATASSSTSSPQHVQHDKKRKKKKKSKKSKSTQENQQYREQELLLAKQQRMKYVDMFMVHEWMVDIPHDLATNWLVGLRAEGDRCLVFASGGRTVSRNRTGNFIHDRFPSSLPGGNIVQQKKSCVTILDCIWIAHIHTYYVIDCLLWSDQKIGLSDACMRLWFVRSKLAECWNIDTRSKYNKYRFVAIETMQVTPDNLRYLYQGGDLLNNQHSEEKHDEQQKRKQSENYGVIGVDDKQAEKQWYKMQPDGLIFYHKHGCYVQSLSCPLILVWKDRKISRWFVDTSNRQNDNKLLQFITLQLRANGALSTHEEDIVLGMMSMQNIQKYQFRPNDLLRFTVTDVRMNECTVQNLMYLKRASVSKMQADTWSKIVFQHQAKHECSVEMEDILEAVSKQKSTDDEQHDDGGAMLQDHEHDVDDVLRVATLGLNDFHI